MLTGPDLYCCGVALAAKEQALKSKVTRCPFGGKEAEQLEFLGVKLTACKCVPPDRFYAISIPSDLAAPTGYEPFRIPYRGMRPCGCFAALVCTEHALDVKYDGVTLRLLVEQEEMRQRTERTLGSFEPFTPAQRAAVSAHWSAELRKRVEASKESDRERVVLDRDPEDL